MKKEVRAAAAAENVGFGGGAVVYIPAAGILDHEERREISAGALAPTDGDGTPVTVTFAIATRHTIATATCCRIRDRVAERVGYG